MAENTTSGKMVWKRNMHLKCKRASGKRTIVQLCIESEYGQVAKWWKRETLRQWFKNSGGKMVIFQTLDWDKASVEKRETCLKSGKTQVAHWALHYNKVWTSSSGKMVKKKKRREVYIKWLSARLMEAASGSREIASRYTGMKINWHKKELEKTWTGIKLTLHQDEHGDGMSWHIKMNLEMGWGGISRWTWRWEEVAY